MPVRAASELDLSKQYRLDLSANKVAYERALAALEAFASRSGEPGGMVLSDMRLYRMGPEISRFTNLPMSPLSRFSQ